MILLFINFIYWLVDTHLKNVSAVLCQSGLSSEQKTQIEVFYSEESTEDYIWAEYAGSDTTRRKFHNSKHSNLYCSPDRPVLNVTTSIHMGEWKSHSIYS
jgi:hypothetical protein